MPISGTFHHGGRRRVRPLRVAALAGSLTLVVASAVVGVRNANERAAEKQSTSLRTVARDQARSLETYFERAREINLLAAQNPAFRNFTQLGGDRLTNVKAAGKDITAASEALEYLERLYPGAIGEACFIDASGAENARVVGGEHAHVDELSPDESKNPFFAPTFRLPRGWVYQATPYVSPDTNEWVISNSTPIPSKDGKARAILHFEVSLESFRRELAATSPETVLRIVDRATGAVILDSRFPQTGAEALGHPDDTSLVPVLARASEEVVDIDGARHAFQPVEPTDGNANRWAVVATTPVASGFALVDIGLSSILFLAAALLLLGLAALGFRSYQTELRTAALTDSLTGLPNRALFLDRAEQALAVARREGLLTAVLMVDLDRFKDVNDTLGHDVGNELLRGVADRLAWATRQGDTVARLGGDEFAILLVRCESFDTILSATARLRGELEPQFTVGGHKLTTRASIGIAVAPDHAEDVASLLRLADIAMYEAKRSGSGTTVYRPEINTFGVDRLALLTELRGAIDANQLALEYQPKVNLRTGILDGVEALVRWDHPTRGRVAASEFISLAEDAGMIKPLTTQVITLALTQCRAWLDEGLELQIAVNLSARCVQDFDTVEIVARNLTRSRVPARLLKLEVTESSLVGDTKRAIEVMNRLTALGVTLSIDDYGTGYSSLSYLQDLPIQELKIDRTFLNDTSDASAREIVRSTVDLGHKLGLRVVAEGVEDPNTVQELLAIGCDVAQGFFFGRPMSADELTTWLRRHNPAGGRTETASTDGRERSTDTLSRPAP